MSIDEHKHVALPKLLGAPAYARPPRHAEEAPRPFDPDDLPITAFQTDEERQLLETLPARAYAPGGGVGVDRRDDHRNGHSKGQDLHLVGRPFRLKSLAGRLLRGN